MLLDERTGDKARQFKDTCLDLENTHSVLVKEELLVFMHGNPV